MTALTTKQILDVPQQLILEVALGIEEGEILAARHGFSPTQWEELKEYAPFIKAVKEKVSELGATGVTFRLRCGVAADHLMKSLAEKALHEDASYSQVLDAFKVFTKAAGTDSPPENVEKLSAKFTININLGAGNVVQVSATIPTKTMQSGAIEGESEEVKEGVEEDLGVVPVYFLGRDLLLVSE